MGANRHEISAVLVLLRTERLHILACPPMSQDRMEQWRQEKEERREARSPLRCHTVGVCDRGKNEVPGGVVGGDVHQQHVTKSTVKALCQAIRLQVVCSGTMVKHGMLREVLSNIREKGTTSVAE